VHEFKVIEDNLIEEDLATGESNVEKNVSVGAQSISPQIRH